MDLRTFITAGNATFTVVSKKSGTRFTYKVRHADHTPPRGVKSRYYVSVLTGPHNIDDFTYAGMLSVRDDGGLMWAHTRGSKIARTAPSWAGFQWLVSRLNAQSGNGQELIEQHAEVHHQGKCGRCGRALTVPESIESGFGPECINKVGA